MEKAKQFIVDSVPKATWDNVGVDDVFLALMNVIKDHVMAYRILLLRKYNSTKKFEDQDEDVYKLINGYFEQ